MELSLIEPVEPTHEVNQCEEELKRHCSKQDKCKEHKAKVFVVIEGQCSPSMKNKIEADKDHKDWRLTDDVVSLLTKIKKSLCSTAEVHHKHWAMMTNIMHKIVMVKQNDGEVSQAI